MTGPGQALMPCLTKIPIFSIGAPIVVAGAVGETSVTDKDTSKTYETNSVVVLNPAVKVIKEILTDASCNDVTIHQSIIADENIVGLFVVQGRKNDAP